MGSNLESFYFLRIMEPHIRQYVIEPCQMATKIRGSVYKQGAPRM